MILEAEKNNKLKNNMTIVEGTGGNTGITLAMIANARGYKTILTMPKTLSKDKILAMKSLNAEIILTEPCGFDNKQH